MNIMKNQPLFLQSILYLSLLIIYSIIIGQSPFNGCDEDELFWSICNEQAFFPTFLIKEAVQLLTLVSTYTCTCIHTLSITKIFLLLPLIHV